MFMNKLEGPALEAYRLAVNMAVERAVKELSLRREEIVVRMLRPEDVGLSTPEWTFNLASGDSWNNNMVNSTIADGRYVVIAGVMVGESSAQASTQLRVTSAGKKVRYWQPQNVNYTQDNMMWFTDPIITGQNETLTIDIYATSADADHQLQLLGATVERKGLLVQ